MAVQALSLPQRGLALTRDEMRALTSRNGIATAAFGSPRCLDEEAAPVLAALATRLDGLLHNLRSPEAFVRLGSRSPKDTHLALLSGLKVESGQEAVAALTAGSWRVAFDLRVAWQAGLVPWIWLRAWQPIEWSDEWRAFVRRGRLVGVSQYVHTAPLPRGTASAAVSAALSRACDELVRALGAARDLQSVVADWWLPADGPARLIELNPWGPPTEPALFRWEEHDLDGTLRWRASDGVHRLRIADP